MKTFTKTVAISLIAILIATISIHMLQIEFGPWMQLGVVGDYIKQEREPDKGKIANPDASAMLQALRDSLAKPDPAFTIFESFGMAIGRYWPVVVIVYSIAAVSLKSRSRWQLIVLLSPPLLVTLLTRHIGGVGFVFGLSAFLGAVIGSSVPRPFRW